MSTLEGGRAPGTARSSAGEGAALAHHPCDHQPAPASAILAFGAPVEKVRRPRTAWSTRGPRTMPSIVRLGRGRVGLTLRLPDDSSDRSLPAAVSNDTNYGFIIYIYTSNDTCSA